MKLLVALYTDEDVSALVAKLLRSRGLDITTVPEQKALGKTDREQLLFAASMLISSDCTCSFWKKRDRTGELL